MNINDIRIKADYIGEVASKREISQEIISSYYEALGDKYSVDTFYNTAQNIRDCSLFWWFNSYEKQRIRDLDKVSMCHNKFCLNCQKAIQATRLYRFTPVLDEYVKDYDLYHCVLTLPNVNGTDLKRTIDLMFRSYKLLNRILSGNSKIKFMNFSEYGYVGSIRSLEVTYQNDYHPHLHCILILEKNLEMYKLHINDYSYDRGVFKRKFSDFEIFIQKIWYLLLNGQKVTLNAINELKQGYSCIIDKIDENSYYEVFKYATKVYKDDNDIMTFEQFETLYNALYCRKTIQGYGVLYNISCGDDIDESNKKLYDDFIASLEMYEKPVNISYKISKLLKELYDDDNKFIYISRRNIFDYLKAADKENDIFEYKNPLADQYVEFDDGSKVSVLGLMQDELKIDEIEKENIKNYFDGYNKKNMTSREYTSYQLEKIMYRFKKKKKRDYYRAKSESYEEFEILKKYSAPLKLNELVKDYGADIDEQDMRYFLNMCFVDHKDREIYMDFINLV